MEKTRLLNRDEAIAHYEELLSRLVKKQTVNLMDIEHDYMLVFNPDGSFNKKDSSDFESMKDAKWEVVI